MPGSLGAASVQQLSAKLAVREAEFALPDGGTRIIAVADTAQSLFSMGSYRGSSARLIGVAWSAEPLRADIGAETDRDRLRRSSWPLSTGAGVDAARRDVGARGGDRRPLPRRSRPRGSARRSARCTARRLCRQDGDRPGPSGRDQRRLPLAINAACERKPVVAAGAGRWRAYYSTRGLARLDFGHPLLGVLRPRADDLHVFVRTCTRSVRAIIVCAFNPHIIGLSTVGPRITSTAVFA